MTHQDRKELYADLCRDLKDGVITKSEFKRSAEGMGISFKQIMEDVDLYRPTQMYPT